MVPTRLGKILIYAGPVTIFYLFHNCRLGTYHTLFESKSFKEMKEDLVFWEPS